MSEFNVPVVRIEIEEHPNADLIEIARVGGYCSIVKKGVFKTGDLAVYIPEAAVVPEYILQSMNLWDYDKNRGMLAGSSGTRVKAIKLRGILSQGLVYPLCFLAAEGEDVKDVLGITKYEPPIPVHLQGEVCNVHGHTLKYDIENFKKYPCVINDGEDVFFTEKIHGTWCCIAYIPSLNKEELFGENNVIITSKGLSASGVAFKNNEKNKNNTYVRVFNKLEKEFNLISKIKELNLGTSVYLLGEVFGSGIQDLIYGMKDQSFRLFDIYIGTPGNGKYLNYKEFIEMADKLSIETVPLLYKGEFSKDVMEAYTNGKETISNSHIREGIVIKPLEERTDIMLGRVILKSVSEAYILRNNGTEFN